MILNSPMLTAKRKNYKVNYKNWGKKDYWSYYKGLLDRRSKGTVAVCCNWAICFYWNKIH